MSNLESEALANADRAYGSVLEQIVTRQIAAGSPLTEGAIAEELDMSRTPVREAFLRLRTDGLINLYPKRGAIVTVPDGELERDLLETRTMIETTAIRRLAERGVDRQLPAELRKILAEQDRAQSAFEFAQSDQRMHEQIVAAAGNRVMTELFEQIGPRLMRYWHRAAESSVAREQFLVDHRELVGLALVLDADGFARRLQEHLRSVTGNRG